MAASQPSVGGEGKDGQVHVPELHGHHHPASRLPGREVQALQVRPQGRSVIRTYIDTYVYTHVHTQLRTYTYMYMYIHSYIIPYSGYFSRG